MNYEAAIMLPASKKSVLAILEAAAPAKLFDLDSGAQYMRESLYFVSGVIVNGERLIAGTLPLDSGEFYYSPDDGMLYVRLSDDSDPVESRVYIVHKFFFSDSGANLPFDLSTGAHVNFDSRISSIGAIGQALDDENIGVVFETKSSISLINSDGFMDEIFDTLVWEGQSAQLYSWLPSTPVSEAKLIFAGEIFDKSFSSSAVKFGLVDRMYSLRKSLSMDDFADYPGNVSDSDLDVLQNRVYGRADNIKCVGVDKIGDGRSHTLQLSLTQGSTAIDFTGVITGFVYQDDELAFDYFGEEKIVKVGRIAGFSLAELSEESDITIGPVEFVIRPARNRKRYNRSWVIAGHPLHIKQMTIESILSPTTYEVDSVESVRVGDFVEVNDIFTTIRSITGSTVRLSQVIAPSPIVGQSINRLAVQAATLNGVPLIPGRDFILDNATSATLNLESLAEFNLTGDSIVDETDITFTNASVSTSSSVADFDLRTVVKVGDYIKPRDASFSVWYEVVSMTSDTMRINPSFSGSFTGNISVKSPAYAGDDALVTTSCYGKANADGEWIETPSMAVLDILENDAEITAINTASFTAAHDNLKHVASWVISGSGSPISVRDALSQLCPGVLASVYLNSDFEVCMGVMNADRAAAPPVISDDDIIDFSVKTENRIVKDVTARYSFYSDPVTGEEASRSLTESSDIVTEVVGGKASEEVDIYLYDELSARTLAQRIAFFRSLSTATVSVSAKTIFNTYSLNDRLILSLDRLFKRFGGGSRKKACIVSAIKKNGYGTEIELSDLGNIFNRVAAVSDNSQDDFGSSTEDEVAKCGYVTDNDTETPDAALETGLGSNLVG